MNEKEVDFKTKYADRTIEGGSVKGHDAVGYCHYRIHKGYLLKKHFDKHKCADKKCSYFEKNQDSDYQRAKNFKKDRKKFFRIAEKLYKSNKISINDYTYIMNELFSCRSSKQLGEKLSNEKLKILKDCENERMEKD